jgi:XTP/dITP diphosphohydrolase
MAPHIHWDLLPDDAPELPETQETIVGNALQKARAAYALTGRTVMADDSGLCVEALRWRPGVRSKRYSPEGTDAANNALLLDEMRTATNRRAIYFCVLALVGEGIEHLTWGACEGFITDKPSGSGGFAYDSLFVRKGMRVTVASLPEMDQLRDSHRWMALQKMLPWLERR